MKRRVLLHVVYALAGVALLLVAWEIAFRLVANDSVVPSTGDCLKKAWGLLGKNRFWQYFGSTLKRVFLAFVISFFGAGVLAVFAYLAPVFGRILSPLISVLRSLPVLAVTLIFWLMFGREDTPIAVAFLSLFPMLYAGFSSALAGVDRELIVMSKVYNVPLGKRITALYLPSVTPYVVREGGAALSFALKLVVSAEVLAGTYKSVGYLMQDAKMALDMPLLFALVCVSAAAGLLLEYAAYGVVRLLERRLK